MKSSYLNKLPKDILVYLIENIQQKQSEQIELLKKSIKTHVESKNISECLYPGCDEIFVSGYDGTSMAYPASCYECNETWCGYHVHHSTLKYVQYKYTRGTYIFHEIMCDKCCVSGGMIIFKKIPIVDLGVPLFK